jgi:hypothetical protein
LGSTQLLQYRVRTSSEEQAARALDENAIGGCFTYAASNREAFTSDVVKRALTAITAAANSNTPTISFMTPYQRSNAKKSTTSFDPEVTTMILMM